METTTREMQRLHDEIKQKTCGNATHVNNTLPKSCFGRWCASYVAPRKDPLARCDSCIDLDDSTRRKMQVKSNAMAVKHLSSTTIATQDLAALAADQTTQDEAVSEAEQSKTYTVVEKQ